MRSGTKFKTNICRGKKHQLPRTRVANLSSLLCVKLNPPAVQRQRFNASLKSRCQRFPTVLCIMWHHGLLQHILQWALSEVGWWLAHTLVSRTQQIDSVKHVMNVFPVGRCFQLWWIYFISMQISQELNLMTVVLVSPCYTIYSKLDKKIHQNIMYVYIINYLDGG